MKFIGGIALATALGVIIGYSIQKPPPAREPTEACHHDATTFRCVKYLNNYDGDTINFDIPNVHPLIGEKISVRVSGVDTPEKKGNAPCEKEKAAKAQLLVAKTLQSARSIELQNVKKDKYFRINADVIADGQSLRQILLKGGLAYEYEGGTKAKVNWCQFH